MNTATCADGLEPLLELLRSGRAVALAGAGCSTESGIPDYRGPTAPARQRAPIQYQEFMRSAAARRRYWARSTIGWPRIAAARPNPAHVALARMERSGVLAGVITQNVDGLHHTAGSRRVVELHGNLARVRCVHCERTTSRAGLQARLLERNAAWAAHLNGGGVSAPDGDAQLEDAALVDFEVPACDGCGGMLKPDLVFFGENVPPARVADAWRLFDEADVLLVVGSSLTVYSGRRFVYRARQQGTPIAVINLGPTRADEAAAVKIEARLGEILPRISSELTRRMDARGASVLP